MLPHPKLILEQIGVSSDIESTFIDRGAFKECWQISEDKVLLIHKDIWANQELEKVYSVWTDDLPWKHLEPRVFKLGKIMLDTEVYWAIMERFRQIPDVDNDIGNAIYNIDYYVDAAVDKCMDISYNGINLEHMDYENFSNLMSLSEEIYHSTCLDGFNNEHKSDYDIIREHLNLNAEWGYELIQNYVFKTGTNRRGDLFVNNFGFRIGTGRPVFFDW